MGHSIKVSAVVFRPDPGGLEERTVTAQFEVPMTGSRYGWHMDGVGSFRLEAATFEFQAPDIELLLTDARNIARGELISELAKMPIGEVVEILTTVKDHRPWGD